MIPFNRSPYIHEWLQLSKGQKKELEEIYNLYHEMISMEHLPSNTWEALNSWGIESFKSCHKFCKEKELKNLTSWLGRRYNMMVNVPKSFEVYQGRIYDISY